MYSGFPNSTPAYNAQSPSVMLVSELIPLTFADTAVPYWLAGHSANISV